MAVATGVDHASAVFVGALTPCIFVRRRSVVDTGIFVLPAVVVVIVACCVNKVLSGSAMPLSTQTELFIYPGSYWLSGQEGLSAQRNSFGFSVRYGIECLFGQNGFMWYNPILLLGLFCAAREIRHRGAWAIEAAAVLCATIAVIVFYSATTSNFSGDSYSVRWFLLYVSPCVFFVFRSFQRVAARHNRLFITLAATGLIIAAAGWVDPWPQPGRYPAFVKNVRKTLVKAMNSINQARLSESPSGAECP